MEGMVTDFYDDSDYFGFHCMRYFSQNKSCTFDTSKCFELSPASIMTLADVLQVQIIVQVLTALDPSFYYLTNTLSVNNDLIYDDIIDDYNDYCSNEYTIRLMIDGIELNNLDQVDNHVTDALYVILSWVSCIMIRRHVCML